MKTISVEEVGAGAGPRYRMKFDLKEEGRKYGSNRRQYIIQTAQSAVNGPVAQERIKLGEALGYYGHGIRVKLKKNRVGETYLNAKGEVVPIVPSHRTTYAHVDDNGIMEHEQEILTATDEGKAVAGLIKSKVGGFSWAADGAPAQPGVVKDYWGMDYVLNPNFIHNAPYDRQLLDSAGDELRDNLREQGLADEYIEQFLDDMEGPSQLLDEMTDLRELLVIASNSEAEQATGRREAEKTLSQITQLLDGLGEALPALGCHLPVAQINGLGVTERLQRTLSLMAGGLKHRGASGSVPTESNLLLDDAIPDFKLPCAEEQKTKKKKVPVFGKKSGRFNPAT